MKNTVIDIHNVSKIYNPDTIPVYAVNNVHLHLERGEFTALVGPSGSGKTTLLNIIGGLDVPTEGKVVINRTDITALSPNQLIQFRLRNIGFVFQSFNSRSAINLLDMMTQLDREEGMTFIFSIHNARVIERTRCGCVHLFSGTGLFGEQQLGC